MIASVKLLPPGSPVSYGGTHITQGYERIAVVPIGYADGFRRKPNNWGEVLVRGHRAPIVGRVCMDQCMINVTHIPEVQLGDEVVLIGWQGDDRIRAEDVAVKLGTNNYETTSMVMARVPRIYLAE
jgi:alanine racemase